jgi:Tol biopolymer transport system component
VRVRRVLARPRLMQLRPFAFAFLGVAGSLIGACGGGDSSRGDHAQAAPLIAFLRTSVGSPPRYDLATARADGREIRVLSGGSRKGTVVPTSGPAWSPDGSVIAFGGARRRVRSGFHSDIYVMRADGTGVRKVTQVGNAFGPLWSQDGRTIVWTRQRLAGGTSLGSLWAVQADGTGSRQLTPGVKGRVDAAGSFSSAGDRLFFTRTTCAPPSRGGCFSRASAIYVAKSDGSSEQLLARHASDPAVSPDGSNIAFVSDRDKNGALNYGDTEFFANELYVMNSDRSGQRRLTRTRELNEAKPTWLQDGTRLAFQRGEQVDNAEGMSLFQINSDGTCERKILADPRLDTWYASPAWRPGQAQRGGGRLTCG